MWTLKCHHILNIYTLHTKFKQLTYTSVNFTEMYEIFLSEVLDQNGSQGNVQGGVLIPFKRVCVSVSPSVYLCGYCGRYAKGLNLLDWCFETVLFG